MISPRSGLLSCPPPSGPINGRVAAILYRAFGRRSFSLHPAALSQLENCLLVLIGGPDWSRSL